LFIADLNADKVGERLDNIDFTGLEGRLGGIAEPVNPPAESTEYCYKPAARV
jgi:hypothetical protein